MLPVFLHCSWSPTERSQTSHNLSIELIFFYSLGTALWLTHWNWEMLTVVKITDWSWRLELLCCKYQLSFISKFKWTLSKELKNASERMPKCIRANIRLNPSSQWTVCVISLFQLGWKCYESTFRKLARPSLPPERLHLNRTNETFWKYSKRKLTHYPMTTTPHSSVRTLQFKP